MAKSLIKHKIHNGAATFLWQDNWHLLGPLCLHFDERIIYDVAIPSNSKADVIIFKPDSVVWISSLNGKFHIASKWNHLYPRVLYHGTIWFGSLGQSQGKALFFGPRLLNNCPHMIEFGLIHMGL